MENSTDRTWKITALILGILNVVLIASIWLRPHPPLPPCPPAQAPHAMHGHDGPPPNGGPGEFLSQELQLDPAQLREFYTLRDEHRMKIKGLQNNGRELRDNYFNLLKSDKPDSAEVNKLASGIAANQKEIELATFHHFEKVRTICNPEQKQLFDNIIGDVLRMMGRPPGGPPHGHGENHRPRDGEDGPHGPEIRN